MDAVDRNVVLRDEVLDNGIGAAAAESRIVFRVTGFVGESFNRDEEPLVVVLICHHLVEGLLRFGVELICVELEVTVVSATCL